MKNENLFSESLGVIKAETFSAVYPMVNKYIASLQKSSESRAGEVKEILDIKTHITNPYRRCVGGCRRNINIFFLLAEAMWIATGRKDVRFLTLFNSKMAEFSDDGETFHAPYGYRLRHWGVRTEDKFIEEGMYMKGRDQVIDAIRILTENPNSRQVVMSIWNPNFDLGYKTKDIPCNDIVMIKVRDGKLVTSIANRSNDLHLGLPTNIFQFSFLTEVMANSLGYTLGTQTHNSQSLHAYSWNKTTERMEKAYDRGGGDMYENYDAEAVPMDYHFAHQIPMNRFREVELTMNQIINNLLLIADGKEEQRDEVYEISVFSDYLYAVYQLLKTFLIYKANLPKQENEAEKNGLRRDTIKEIEKIEATFHERRLPDPDKEWDVTMLAKNYFWARLTDIELIDGDLGTL